MATATDAVADPDRRRALQRATAAAGGLTVAAAGYPFLASLAPSERARAQGGPVEAELAPIAPGELATVEWRGKPVWLLRRTPRMLDRLASLRDELADPDSEVAAQQPAYARNAARSIRPEVFVSVALCTHLGCVQGLARADQPRRAGAPLRGAPAALDRCRRQVMQRRRFLALSGALLAVACDRRERAAKFNATDITGVDWARGFELADHTGKRRTLEDFRGKVVMAFFGFTSCADACPLALAEMAEAVRRLGPDGAHVQGLFITVDPARDTAEVLSKYVPAFHPAFLGLRGTAEETARTAKEWKVHYQATNAREGNAKHYMVDHTSAIFVLDARGQPRLYVSQNGRSVERIVEDLRRLLNELS